LERVLRGRLEWIAQVRGRSFSAYRTLARRFNQQFPKSAIPILPTYEEIAEHSVWVIDFFAGEDCEQGTAFFLEGVGLVTADHVLEKLPVGEFADLYRPGDPSRKFKARPSKFRCSHRDLVILEHNVPASQHLNLPVATSPEHRDDDIVALGFPNFGPGDQLGKRRGHIIGRATKHAVKLIEVSAMLSGGISGGPIVNSRYQVIAVSHRGGNQEHKQLAIDVSELTALANEVLPDKVPEVQAPEFKMDRVSLLNADQTVFEVHSVPIGMHPLAYARALVGYCRRVGRTERSYRIERFQRPSVIMTPDEVMKSGE
jgi:hypothetical protein